MGHFPTLSLTDMVKNKRVTFTHYREGELWYVTEDGFEFPVPIDDCGNAMFKADDNALFFMRYIRKRIDAVEKWKQDGVTSRQGGVDNPVIL